MSTFITTALETTDLPAVTDFLKRLRTLPLADERGRELLARWCLSLGAERTERLLAATRAQLRCGSHIATPQRAAPKGPPGASMHPNLWTSEAEACAYRGAGIYLDFVLPALRHFEGRIDRSWADPCTGCLSPARLHLRSLRRAIASSVGTLAATTSVIQSTRGKPSASSSAGEDTRGR